MKAEKIKQAILEAVGSRAGKWHVQLIGNLAEPVWELRVSGPGVETSEYLDGAAGQHEPEFIGQAVRQALG